jgi:transposase
LSTEKRQLIVRLYQIPRRDGKRRTQEDIAYDLGVHVNTVQNVLKRYKKTGTVSAQPRVHGRHRTLTVFDVDVSFTIHQMQVFANKTQFLEAKVEQVPDIHLEELRDSLYEVSGIHVCLKTIWNALQGRGFTRKQVSLFFIAVAFV